MISFKLKSHLTDWLGSQKKLSKKIGFVPTMGALHQGHISLVQESQKENDLTVCSIFVNPTQFNQAEDLKNYPRTLEKDFELLLKAGCDAVFIPEVAEVYSDSLDYAFPLGSVAELMEGKHRPGHFSGVLNVLKRLFDIVQPQRSYFGQKDFQQCLVVKKLLAHYGWPIDLRICPIVREADGLAMSSRNQLLDSNARAQAPFIYQTLSALPVKMSSGSPAELEQWAQSRFAEHPAFELEYFEIANADTLERIGSWHDAENIVACVAARLGKVRLIDNVLLK